jgi:hypothetical protein
MTWEQRFGALIELDGDEWDAAHKRLEQEWLAAYTAAFVEIAVSRGWRRENAETWPVGIGDEPQQDVRSRRRHHGRLRLSGQQNRACAVVLKANRTEAPIQPCPIQLSTPYTQGGYFQGRASREGVLD